VLVLPSTEGNVLLRVDGMISTALVMLCRDVGSPHPEKPQRLSELQPLNDPQIWQSPFALRPRVLKECFFEMFIKSRPRGRLRSGTDPNYILDVLRLLLIPTLLSSLPCLNLNPQNFLQMYTNSS
jgi:hypothetical protein